MSEGGCRENSVVNIFNCVHQAAFSSLTIIKLLSVQIVEQQVFFYCTVSALREKQLFTQ